MSRTPRSPAGQLFPDPRLARFERWTKRPSSALGPRASSPESLAALHAMSPAARLVYALLLAAPGVALREPAMLDQLRAVDPWRWCRTDRDPWVVLGSALLRVRAELDRAGARLELVGSGSEGWCLFPRRAAGPVERVPPPREEDCAGVWKVLPGRRAAGA